MPCRCCSRPGPRPRNSASSRPSASVTTAATSSRLHRLPGARLTGVEISIAKAFTAAGHERATHLFNEPPNGPALPGNEAFGISHMLPGKFAIFVGGFPIVHEGQIVGGVGVSGGNGEQDKAVGAAMLAEFEALTASAPRRG